MSFRVFKLIVGFGWLAATAFIQPVQANIVGLNSNAALGAFDSINWSQLDPNNTNFFGPQNVVSTGGVNGAASSAGNQFQTLTQDSNSWDGNFTPGVNVLWTVQKGPDITISVANATRGIGAQIQADSLGAFTAKITAINAGGTLLGSYAENGASTNAGDNTAIFIGLFDDTADISKIVFSLTTAPGPTNDFAIGPVDFSTQVSSIPEASSWAMVILGFAGIGLIGRRRLRTHPMKFAV